ncbi:MAG: DUF1840 family protein [Albidovulum sp.]
MLVTFRTDAHADIPMFGAGAVRLLERMGHGGTVPGALLADEVPAARERSRSAVAAREAALGPCGNRRDFGGQRLQNSY